MTKPAILPAPTDVVEIDAMDVAEWESGQRTPLASDTNLAELVRRTAELPVPVVPSGDPTSPPSGHPARRRTATLVPARTPLAKLSVPPPMPRQVAAGSSPKLAPPQQAAAAPPTGARLPVLTTPGELEVTVPFMFKVPPAASEFAEPSRVGPGHRSSPAGSAEPNTAWPPRPIPAGVSASFDRPVSSDGMPRATGHEAEVTARLPVALTRRRLGWIAATAGAILLGVAVVVALLRGRGHAPSSREDRTPGAAPPASEVAPAPAARSAVPAAPAGEPVRPPMPTTAGAAPAQGATARIEQPPTASTPAPGPVYQAAKRIRGKKVIVDYTARPSDPPPPSLLAQSEEDPAVGKARTAYAAGNQQLFAGDLAGAIRAYHEALEIYPGYVGGYRGLGLAYAQAGENAQALEALKTYVAAVPTARDAALIRKRIAHLQGK